MKVAILGGTRGMGRALARAMAARGDAICLLGRDESELRRSRADLLARGESVVVSTATCDLAEPSGFAAALTTARDSLAGLDCVVVTAAQFAPQEELEQDLSRTAQLLQANFTNTILFCEHARQRLLEHGGGTLCVFSSVAGERGRKPQVIYGASKAGLSAYLEGLDHRYHAAGLVTICVKPGFVKTGMTQGLKPPPFAGEPDAVARDVLRAIDRRRPVLFTPWPWRWVMLVIRNLPRFVMRRINF